MTCAPTYTELKYAKLAGWVDDTGELLIESDALVSPTNARLPRLRTGEYPNRPNRSHQSFIHGMRIWMTSCSTSLDVLLNILMESVTAVVIKIYLYFLLCKRNYFMILCSLYVTEMERIIKGVVHNNYIMYLLK